jgi:hypothetical protein
MFRQGNNEPGWLKATLVFCLIVMALAFATTAFADPTLIDRHKAAGIACAGCHTESPPAKAVTTATCIGCHGAYTVIAAKTAKDDPNPHASHRGDLPCESCHKVHKASVDFCAQCHDFSFKVP